MKLVLQFVQLLSFIVFSLNCLAQVQTKYSQRPLLSEKGMFNVSQQATILQLPKVDVSRLMKEDSVEANLGIPFRFGYALDVNYTLENSGTWFETPQGRVWKLGIQSKGAYSINLIFENLSLPDSGKIYIYNNDRTMIYGPITGEECNDSGNFGTDLLKGQIVIVELYEPKNAQKKSTLKITKAVHGYKDMFNTPNVFGDALGCHNNVNCSSFSAWQEQSNSVAMVLLADNTRYCSGALLNNVCEDMTPNFLTAFHCIDIGNSGTNPCDGEAGNGTLNSTEINRAENWLFRFQYKSPTCSPSTEPTSWITFNGSTYRSGWFDSDFALVEMDNKPNGSSGIQYAGWSRSTLAPSSGANIHHPRGDVMKISTFNNPATNSTSLNWAYKCPPLYNTTPASSHWTVTLSSGTAEGGSSGGPLFDQNGRVVGQLHGGAVGCAPVNMHYGKLDRSWGKDAAGNFLSGRNATNSLASWLDPSNTGAMATNMTSPTSLTGPDDFCTSDTYTVSGLPTGQSVSSWSANPSGVTISGGGSTVTVTRAGTFNGKVTLTATVTGSCGTYDISKEVQVGTPTPEITNVYVYPEYNQIDVLINTVPGATSYEYYIDGVLDGSTLGSSHVYSFYGVPCGYTYHLSVKAIGPCGPSWEDVEFAYLPCVSPFTVFPNPANESLTVTAEGENTAAKSAGNPSSGEFNVKLYNGQGRLLREADSRDGSVTLDTQELPEGTHYLHISRGKETVKRQVVIRH